MSAYQQTLSQVMDAILAGNPESASTLWRGHNHFAVYTDGYRLRLVEVLMSAYPAVTALLGDADMRALALRYVEAHPSRHFNIDHYPIGFATTVRASTDTFAGELATLEEAIHAVYQGAESSPLSQEWIAAQTPESLMQATLQPRTASRVLAFDYPVNDYLTAFRNDENPSVPTRAATYLLVFRHHNQVQRLPLAAGEYALLSAGKPLGDALESVSEQDGAQVTQWLARWAQSGCLRHP